MHQYSMAAAQEVERWSTQSILNVSGKRGYSSNEFHLDALLEGSNYSHFTVGFQAPLEGSGVSTNERVNL